MTSEVLREGLVSSRLTECECLSSFLCARKQIRSEALCDDPVLHSETPAEISPIGDPMRDIMCQSERNGEVLMHPLCDFF